MKLLYITSQIKGDGGVQKTISVKTNYFIENYNFDIDIVSMDIGTDLFFDFNTKINFHYIKLKSNKLTRFLEYKNQVQKSIKKIKPDCIIVCDFGLKGFAIPFFIKTNVPIVFEAHGSKYNESSFYKKTFFSKISHNLKYKFRDFCAHHFHYFIALSKESLVEWTVKNGFIIPNSIEVLNKIPSDLNSKKIIVVARHSYEKGLDRLMEIWKITSKKFPDWKLEIYGSKDQDLGLEKLIVEYGISESVTLLDAVKNIDAKFQEASIFLMTSRSEAFPMVILEAMSSGLPVIAYDCPIGPRAIIQQDINGFLIKDGHVDLFVNKLLELMINFELRKKMGVAAFEQIKQYSTEKVMTKWYDFFSAISK
jgi:glycosyltransferase involved in cell wall biosynthesis